MGQYRSGAGGGFRSPRPRTYRSSSPWLPVVLALLPALLALLALLVAVGPARAQTPDDEMLDQVGFAQRLNAQVPLDLTFQDASGTAVRLQDYFGDRPVVLALGYYECPMLCSMVRDGLFSSLQELKFDVGNEFVVLNVSIDPREPPRLAAVTKAMYLQRYNRPGSDSGWHFLTGEETAIRQLAQAVGFQYAYDPEIDQYAHPSGIVILTPQGKISRYLFGIEFAPRDLRLGLVEASANKIGTPVDQVLLRCYHYDPETGKYTLAIVQILQVAGVATVLALGTLMTVMLRRDRRQPGTARQAEEQPTDG